MGIHATLYSITIPCDSCTSTTKSNSKRFTGAGFVLEDQTIFYSIFVYFILQDKLFSFLMNDTQDVTQAPRDAKLTSLILQSMDVEDYDEQLIPQLLDFSHRTFY